jgi:hypothetical protein
MFEIIAVCVVFVALASMGIAGIVRFSRKD